MAKKRASKPRISEEAEIAAQEAIQELEGQETFDSPESRDIQLAIAEQNSLTDREVDEKDIFAEGKKKFIARNTSGQFRIYRDGAWVGTKPSTFTWEKLRREYGKQGGHFKVVAIDGNNTFAGSQSLEVAAEEVEEQEFHSQEPRGNSSLEMLELMKENQREAEAKAQSQQTGIASIMSTMISMQTQSTQTMMQMMQKSAEQNQALILAMLAKKDEPKGPDPILTLLTTLLTQKPKGDELTGVQLVALLDKAKTEAKREAREDLKMIDEKAKKYAEDMTPDNTGEESLTKTIIKAFAPVVADLAAKQQAAGQFQAQAPGNRALNEGFVEGREFRPAIAGPARPAQPPQRRPQPPAGASVSPNPPKSAPVSAGDGQSVEKGPVAAAPAQEMSENDRLQIAIFNVVALDIGQALMSEESASKTAAECLGKLEKAGFSRQTVAKAFTLEDFYRIGKQAGVPDIAKPWLKEFHESIALKEVAEPVRTAADPGAAARPVNGTSGHVAGNGAAGPAVAAGGSKSPGPRPRAQSRDRSKNL